MQNILLSTGLNQWKSGFHSNILLLHNMACVIGLVTIVLVVLALLWKVSPAAKYWIKWFIFGLGSTLSATLPIPIMFLKPRDSRNALIPAAGCRIIERMLGLSASMDGKENIIKNSGCVVLINHQSMLDLVVLAELWPVMDNCTVISKKEIFYLQPFGLACWLWGTIFIDRVNKEKAQEAVNETGKEINARKARVLMFPEGTRNNKKELLSFKKGAFHLAVAAKCPIQPVVVSRYTFLGKNRFDEGHIKIRILPAISTEGYTKETIPELMEKCYNIMSENVDKITKENATNQSTDAENSVCNGTGKRKTN